MIDFHTHILPGIDDGSRCIEQTVEMLQEQQRQGVKKILATPHFYADRESIQTFLHRREESYKKVKKKIKADGNMPSIQLAAEVYYFPGIGKAKLLPELCVEGTNILLLEMPFMQWDKEIYEDVEYIIRKQGLFVILAHVERYYEFQKNKDIWKQVFELPIVPQINAGSFLKWNKRRFGLKLLKEREDVILGSDCHNLESRPPNLLQGREVIRRKLGDERLHQIDFMGERILGEHE